MSSATLVTNFNALDRKPLAPSGEVTNYWHISVRHVELSPPGDLVMILNPAAHYQHNEGPFQLSQLSATAKATTIAPVLLRAFITGMGNPDQTVPKYAPWSWSTNDEELSKELELAFAELGVVEVLRKVRVAGKADNDIADQEWKTFYDDLKMMIANS